MRTLKSLRELGTVRVTRVYTGRWHRDNLDEFLAHLREEAAQRLEGRTFELRPNDTTIALYIDGQATHQHVLVPKHAQRATGEVTFRGGGDYTFLEDGRQERSYGVKLTKDMLRDYGWEVEIEPGRTLQYHIEG